MAACMHLLVACGSVRIGRDFDIGAFEDNVQREVTTRTQVRTWLGALNNTGIERGECNEEWTYYFAEGRLPGLADAKLKILQVRFGPHGTVLS